MARTSRDIAIAAVEAGKAEGNAGPGALFDWPILPDARFEELRESVTTLRNALDRPTALAHVTPPLTADLARLFAQPPDASQLPRPLFSVRESSYDVVSGVWIDGELLGQMFAGVTSPDIISPQTPPTSWTIPVNWDGRIDTGALVTPARELLAPFSCR